MTRTGAQGSEDGVRDVVDLVIERHEQIRALFNDIVTAEGAAKAALLDELVTLLAVHAAVEQELRRRIADRAAEPLPESVKDARLNEVGLVAELSQLTAMEPMDVQFDARLISVARAMTLHAQDQEGLELPLLREALSDDERRALADLMLAAEATAAERAKRIQPTLPASDLGGGTPGLLSALSDAMKAP